MPKMLSEDIVRKIDKVLQRNHGAWEKVKASWGTSPDTRKIDRVVNQYIKVWLDVDRTIDDSLHAHSLAYWKDPGLKPVLERNNKLLVALAKLDEQKRKNKIKQVVKSLDGIISEISK